ncbi:MAG: universal stress protein [Desulforegulaceae bacterium]|nr:universal stress protein [Desulforegulaceae bacterium]
MDNKKYLISLDGSETSLEAVNYASKVLPKNNSEIVLFLVGTDIPESFWDIDAIPEESLSRDTMEDWITKHNKVFTNTLSKAKQKFVDEGFPENSIHIKTQPRKIGITRDIIAEASKGYSAVFAGRKGLSNMRNIPLGSVATKLISKLSFTTLVLVGENPETENILIGFDGSEGSKACVKLAGQIFCNSSKKIHLRHVSRAVKLIQGDYNLFFTNIDPDSMSMENERVKIRNKKIEPELEKAVEKLKSLGFDPKNSDTGIIESYLSRALGIYETAEKKNWGTIFIGRKGVSKVQDFIIGRVGEKVVQMAFDKAVWIVSS